MSTRIVFATNEMSSWIRRNIGKPENGFPPGEFNNKGAFSDSVNAKRIRTNLWPSGKFKLTKMVPCQP